MSLVFIQLVHYYACFCLNSNLYYFLQPPVHVVELSSCITPRIGPAARDVCARPHTFLLVTTREPLPTDANSLVVSVHEKYTAIKNMFSADNKSERDAWIAVVNKALTNMRAWGISEPNK